MKLGKKMPKLNNPKLKLKIKTLNIKINKKEIYTKIMITGSFYEVECPCQQSMKGVVRWTYWYTSLCPLTRMR